MFSCFESTVPANSEEIILDISPRQHVQTSSNLTIMCYTDINKRFIKPCSFKWVRIIDGSTSELTQIKGNSYMCQPDDLGSIIQVEISANDYQKPSKSVVTFGPVQMDLTLKPNIQNIMVADCCREIIKISDYGEVKQCYLSISSRSIQILDISNNILLQVDYFVDSPVFKINPKQPNKVSIVFTLSSYEPLKQFYDSLFKRATSFEGKSIDISFVNRISRDMFIFAHKILSSKKDLKVSELLMVLEQKNRIKNLLNIDSLLVVEYLRRDLKRYIKLYHDEKSQKDLCGLQITQLQEEIFNLRNSYTKYIRDCLKQLHPHTQDSIIEQLDEKNFQYNFQQENKYLKFKIVKMGEEISILKNVQRKIMTKKIFKDKHSKQITNKNLSASEVQIQNLVDSLQQEKQDIIILKKRIQILEKDNLQISKRFSEILSSYEDLKLQKQQLQKQRMDASVRSTQSQQAISTINKLIGDIVQLKKINIQLSTENQKLTGKKKTSSFDNDTLTIQRLQSKLKQTQRLLQVSQESYQRMKEMFQKTQAKYDTPRSSSYQSSASSVSTTNGNKKKLQTPKRKQSTKKTAKLSLECK